MVRISPTVADLLTLRREALGLTRREIAARGGFCEMSVINWERLGRVPRASQFEPICAAYGIDLNTLTQAVAQSLAMKGAA